MTDTLLLDLEARHTAALAEAARRNGDAAEAALTVADSFAAVMSTVTAASLMGLGAKARVVQRQAGGRLTVLIEQGGIAERLLAASTLADAARLIPAPCRARSAARTIASTPRARLPLDESSNPGQAT